MRTFSGGFLAVLLLVTVGAAEQLSHSLSAKDYYVWDLPGLDRSQTKFHNMHAGNIVIKPESNGSLFFWSFESEYIVDNSRLLIWLNGGPGCSSMDGAIMESGPYRIHKDKVVDNDGNWNQFANVVYVDQPLGTGYSTTATNSYVHTLEDVAEDMVTFLKKYFEIFPERLQDEVYIGGESFAGQYIPYVSRAILDHNKKEKDANKRINIQGALIGNGWVEPVQQYLSYLPFAYSKGLLKEGSQKASQVEKLHRDCADTLSDIQASGKNMSIHLPVCEKVTNGMLDILRKDDKDGKCLNIYDVRLKDDYPACGMSWPPDLEYIYPYLRRKEVMRALNTYPEMNLGWEECSGPVMRGIEAGDSQPSSVLIPDLAKEIRVMFFNGDQDLVCNHMGNEKFLENLEWNGMKGWGEAMPEDWLGGQITKARNITYVRVKDGSHMLPFDMPKMSQFMFNAWLGLQTWDGKHNVTTEIIHTPAGKDSNNKAVSDATWKAYYRSGTAALVVLLIVIGVAAYLYYRHQRRYEQEYLGTAAQRKGFFATFLRGLSRWRPKSGPRRRHERQVSGNYQHLQSGSRPSVIMEEEELGLQSPPHRRASGDDTTELDTFVVDDDEHEHSRV